VSPNFLLRNLARASARSGPLGLKNRIRKRIFRASGQFFSELTKAVNSDQAP
jgi:hypothetical protein